MKRNFIIAGMSFFVVTGCAQDNTVPDNPTVQHEEPNEVTEQTKNKNDTTMLDKMDDLPFNQFEFDIDYIEDFDFEVELERMPNDNIDAEYVDERNDIDEKGEKAFDLLYSKLKGLDIHEDTTENEAIYNVLKIFNLPEDYTEFELEIILNNGVKKEFNVQK